MKWPPPNADFPATPPESILDAVGAPLRVGDAVVYSSSRGFARKKMLRGRVSALLHTNYLKIVVDHPTHPERTTTRWRVAKIG